MTSVTVAIDQAAVEELLADWDGPVGDAIERATEEVAAFAEFLAPVGRTGALKRSTRQSLSRHHDEDGRILGLVGAERYPYNFIANPASRKGFTVNRGHRSVRVADDDYLERAIDSVPFQTYRY